MIGTNSSIGTSGAKIYLSHVVGSNNEGKRIFGEVKVFKIDKPIVLGFPILNDQIWMTKQIKCIKETGKGIFVVETVDKFYFEVGFLKDN